MTRKFKFTVSTPYVYSEYTEMVELQFDDGISEKELSDEVDKVYSEWLSQENQGGWVQIN